MAIFSLDGLENCLMECMCNADKDENNVNLAIFLFWNFVSFVFVVKVSKSLFIHWHRWRRTNTLVPEKNNQLLPVNLTIKPVANDSWFLRFIRSFIRSFIQSDSQYVSQYIYLFYVINCSSDSFSVYAYLWILFSPSKFQCKHFWMG